MSFVKLKNNGKLHLCKYSLINEVENIVKKIPNYSELKGDPELLIYILGLVQNGIKKDMKEKMDLKDIAMDIFQKCFNLTPDEKASILKQIEYAINNEHVEAVKVSTKAFSYAKSFFFKNLQAQ